MTGTRLAMHRLTIGGQSEPFFSTFVCFLFGHRPHSLQLNRQIESRILRIFPQQKKGSLPFFAEIWMNLARSIWASASCPQRVESGDCLNSRNGGKIGRLSVF